jgi:hypothetical protein
MRKVPDALAKPTIIEIERGDTCDTRHKIRPSGTRPPDHVLSNPTLYRFRSVSLKAASPDEGTSLLLEVTSGTLVSVETSSAFKSEWASPVLEMSCAPSSLKTLFARLVVTDRNETSHGLSK